MNGRSESSLMAKMISVGIRTNDVPLAILISAWMKIKATKGGMEAWQSPCEPAMEELCFIVFGSPLADHQ